MSLAPTPTIYFNGIDYNPLFYQKASGISLTYASQNYLSRIGPNPISVATKTSFSGNLAITNSASSTDYTNGSLIVSGGVGVTGNINLAGNVQTRKIYVNGETDAELDFGAIRCNGGMYIKKNIFMGTNGSTTSLLLNYGYSVAPSYPYGGSFYSGSIRTYNGSICSYGNINAGDNIACVNNSYCYGNSYVYGNLISSNTTQSYSNDTGSVILNGGVAIKKSLVIGDPFNGNVDNDNRGGIIVLSPITANSYPSASVGLAAIRTINGGGIASSGNVVASQNIACNANLYCYGTTASTSTTTGCAIFSGGVGISGGANINGNINTAGMLHITNTTTGIGTGALIIDGGMSIVRDVFIQGNLYNYKESLINDGGVNNNFAISGVLAVDSIVLGNKLTAPNIICNSLKSWGEVDSLNKIGCFIQLPVFPYSLPVSSSVQDITVCYTNLDLTLILSTSCAVVLQPYYKISFIGPHGYVMTTIDNTLGTTPLYSLLPNPVIYFVDYSVCKSIFLYYNNILK